MTRSTWAKRATLGEIRKPASLDHDVGITLARQWATQQPDSCRDSQGVLRNIGIGDMDWKGRLPTGPKGVRLFVLTLLSWGATWAGAVDGDVNTWNALAQAMLVAFDALAAQAGEYQPPIVTASQGQVGGNKRIKFVPPLYLSKKGA